MNKIIFDRNTKSLSIKEDAYAIKKNESVIGLTEESDIDMIQVTRYYRDDASALHEIALNAEIPKRSVVTNVGMPPPQITAMRPYPEEWQIDSNPVGVANLLSMKKTEATYTILGQCDQKIEQLKVGYSQNEVLSWPIKKQLATDWLLMSSEQKTAQVNSSTYALIVNEAGGATASTRVANTTALAQRILQLAEIFEAYTGLCVKVKKDKVAEVAAASSVEQVQAVISSLAAAWPPIVIPGAPGT